MEALEKALQILDQIDTRNQPWEEADEMLHRVQGLIKEAREGLENGNKDDDRL